MFEVKILVGSLKDATRYAFPRDGAFGPGFIVLDEGDELWYGSEEVKVLSDVLESDCE